MDECEHGSDPATCAACNHKPKTRKASTSTEPSFRQGHGQRSLPGAIAEWQHNTCAPQPSSRPIESKYHGTCVTCLGHIDPGDLITQY